MFVGAGSGPCAILAVGARSGKETVYPVSALAQRHAAGVDVETSVPKEAYAPFRADVDREYRPGWLPG